MTTDHFEARIAELHAADERNKLVETCAIALARADGSLCYRSTIDTPEYENARNEYRTKARVVLDAAENAGNTVVQHIPRRGSDVEAWIKRERDQIARPSFRWDALDDLLDDYREHADTGTPLDAQVAGPFAEVDR